MDRRVSRGGGSRKAAHTVYDVTTNSETVGDVTKKLCKVKLRNLGILRSKDSDIL